MTSLHDGTNCESPDLKDIDVWWNDEWDSQESDQENAVACKLKLKKFISRLKHKVKR